MATSNAMNDGGLFEVNFRDERYMPFEGAGSASSWTLELPKVFRAFDYSTVADVIFHVSYTAKDDGVLRKKVEKVIAGAVKSACASTGLHRLLSLKHDFPSVWGQLSAQGTARIDIGPDQKPLFFFRQPLAGEPDGDQLKPLLAAADLYLQPKVGTALDGSKIAAFKANGSELAWQDVSTLKMTTQPLPMQGKTSVSLDVGAAFDASGVEDVIVLLKYNVE